MKTIKNAAYFHGHDGLTIDSQGNIYYNGVNVSKTDIDFAFTVDEKLRTLRTWERCKYLESIGAPISWRTVEDEDWENYAAGFLVIHKGTLDRMLEGTGLIFTRVFVGCGFGSTAEFLLPGSTSLEEIRQTAEYLDFLVGNDSEIYLIKEAIRYGRNDIRNPSREELSLLWMCLPELMKTDVLAVVSTARYDYEEEGTGKQMIY